MRRTGGTISERLLTEHSEQCRRRAAVRSVCASSYSCAALCGHSATVEIPVQLKKIILYYRIKYYLNRGFKCQPSLTTIKKENKEKMYNLNIIALWIRSALLN